MELATLFNLMILIITSEILPNILPASEAQSLNGNEPAANETRELPVAQPLMLHQASNSISISISNNSESDISRTLAAASSPTTFNIDASNEQNTAYNHQHNSNSNPSLQQDGSNDPKQDRLSQVSSSSLSAASNVAQYQQHNHHNHNHHHQNHHSNHQNYPLEPYPSASYASLVTAAPPSSFLSHRDRHQSASGVASNHQHPFSDYNSDSLNSSSSSPSKFNNSFGNQSPLSNLALNSDQQVSPETNNHNSNYGGSHSSLNTGLIQNLTASLFPVNQLSNVTLLSLSELLNKTRQANTQLSQHFVNEYRPQAASLNELGYPASNYFHSSQQQQQQQQQPHQAVNSLAEQQYGIFDYNHFGFREAGTQYPQPSGGSFFRSTSSQLKPSGLQANNLNYNDNKGNNNLRSPGYKTSSNIYNTYLPYKDSLNSMPTMTNGQSLSMALYDSYMDGSNAGGYKTPLVVNGLPKGSSSPNYGHSANGYSTNSPAGYQYVQHHNINNQNHLDKIVYHSTPFRPSIVSPPMSSPTAAPNLYSSTPMVPPTSTSSSASSSTGASNQVRMKATDADKPMPFASLSSSSSAISDASKADYNSNEQSNKPNRYTSSGVNSKEQIGRVTTEPTRSTTSSTSASTTPATESFEAERRQNGSVKATSSENTNTNTKAPNSLQQIDPKEPIGNPPLSTGQAILFDLYEHEIDNQIRDAIYGVAGAGAMKSQQAEAASMNAIRGGPHQHPARPFAQASNSLYDETGGEQHNMAANWDQPVALGSHETYVPSAAYSANRARPQLIGPPQLASISMDPLSAALQELPTFSASDLQPIFPSAPAYSLLQGTPAASSPQETFAAEAPLAAITSHLWPLSGHHHAVTATNPSHLYGHDAAGGFISMSQPHSSYSGSTSASTNAIHHTSQSPLGLPAFLFKLHSSPLSSILASPLTHLYASLPRNRNKKPTSGNQANKQVAAASQSSHSYSSAPSSFLAHHPLGNIASKQLLKVLGGNSGSNMDTMTSSSSLKPMSIRQQQQRQQQQQQQQQQLQQQQQEAASLAAATASILAAELPLSPLQAALLQTQAANMYLGANPPGEPDLLSAASLASEVSGGLRSPVPQDGHTGGFGLAGGGSSSSPLVWRGIFSPTYWARKQSTTSSGQTVTTTPATSTRNSNQQQAAATTASKVFASPSPLSLIPFISHNQGSHHLKSAGSSGAGPNKSLQNPLSLPLSSLLRGSLASQYLFNPITSASSNSVPQYQQPQQQQQQHSTSGAVVKSAQLQKKPRLKIKILKIPIAFYDQPTSVGSQASGSAPIIMHSGLSPVSATDGASFLAQLACPLSHTGYQPPHTFEQHLLGQHQVLTGSPSALAALNALLPAQPAPPPPPPLLSPLQFTASHLAQSSMAPTNASIENSSISNQGFTDINQPNDLQVSPTTNNQGKMYKTRR